LIVKYGIYGIMSSCLQQKQHICLIMIVALNYCMKSTSMYSWSVYQAAPCRSDTALCTVKLLLNEFINVKFLEEI
jgi:hypothetical protein